MPRKTIDLEPLREQITAWYQDGTKTPQVIKMLKDTYDITVGRSRLRQFYSLWGLKTLEVAEDTEQLRIRLREMFFDELLPDDIILKRLREEGHKINLTQLAKIRCDEKLFRRLTPEQTRVAIEKASIYMNKENQHSTVLRSYGRGLLHVKLRQNKQVISRDAAYEAYRNIFGDEILNRFGKTPFKRRTFNIRGIDEVWSIDGHDKLKHWGFEIYAGIDGYTRYLPWFYCGICNSTAWNVALQYLALLEKRGTMPLKVRSDHGGETSIICALHFLLSSYRTKIRRVPIKPEPHGLLRGGTSEIETEYREEVVPIEFKDCWIFGRSVHNTRIESWWRQLREKVIAKWQNYFMWLSEHGHFDSALPERVAILFLYMTRIRKECNDYVKVWNVHKLRNQPHASHVITGQVNILYHEQENLPRFTQPVDPDLLQFCADGLDLARSDLDAYLPAETMAICSRIIEEKFGTLPLDPPNPASPFVHEYIYLKAELERYNREGREPAISLIPSVTEGTEILQAMLKQRGLTLREEGAFEE